MAQYYIPLVGTPQIGGSSGGGSGGDNLMFVYVYYDDEASKYVSTKTFSEIDAFYNGGALYGDNFDGSKACVVLFAGENVRQSGTAVLYDDDGAYACYILTANDVLPMASIAFFNDGGEDTLDVQFMA